MDLGDQSGRVFVVTGPTSGIGLAATRALAGAGAHVVLAARDMTRATAIARALPVASTTLRLDLADLASVREFADRLPTLVDHVDVLLNNAGVMALPKRRTVDGFEMQIGTNHLGHFALTNLLLPHVTARVVTISSFMHKVGRIDLDDLNTDRHHYRRWRAYSQSKLANLLFTAELQRLLAAAGSPVLSVAAHPGYVSTNLSTHTGNPLLRGALRVAQLLSAQDADQGALPGLFAATADVPPGALVGPDGMNERRGGPTLGGSFASRGRPRPRPQALAAVRRLDRRAVPADDQRMTTMQGRRLTRFATAALAVLAMSFASASSAGAHSTNGGGLDNPYKKNIAMEIVSSNENSSLDWKAQFSYIQDIHDGRGYTAGIIGFCSGTGDMLQLVEAYTKTEPSNPLAKYIPALKRVNGTPSHKGLGRPFVLAWKLAAKDSVFRQAQDHERDAVYFNPAVEPGEGRRSRHPRPVHLLRRDRHARPGQRRQELRRHPQGGDGTREDACPGWRRDRLPERLPGCPPGDHEAPAQAPQHLSDRHGTARFSQRGQPEPRPAAHLARVRRQIRDRPPLTADRYYSACRKGTCSRVPGTARFGRAARPGRRAPWPISLLHLSTESAGSAV